MTIYCRIGEMAVGKRQLPIPAGRWTPAMLDVTPLADVRQLVEPKAAVSLALDCDPPVTVWCDDFMLINNEQTLVGDEGGRTDGSSSESSQGWTIRRRGLHFIGDVPGRFSFKLLTTEGGPHGWRVEEVNAGRARFSSDGPQKMLTIYRDGRAYWDGQYRPFSASAAEPPLVQQHASPARVEVPAEQGRVDRNTEGDANNDGYNESRGAYAVRAAGARLELTLTPRNPQGLFRPVLEVAHLPPGKVQVSLEGRLVEQIMRLEDGTVLIDLPVRVTRPATVYVKVE
jgi:hypothetical protein